MRGMIDLVNLDAAYLQEIQRRSAIRGDFYRVFHERTDQRSLPTAPNLRCDPILRRNARLAGRYAPPADP